MGIKQKEETSLEQFLIHYRHELHRYPELSNQEFKTTESIKKILKEYDVTIMDTSLPTGVVAKIEGRNPGPTIAIRSDIDALPIKEKSGVEYVSNNEGVMHACGHDFHISVILGAAITLNQQREELNGTILVLFQAAEETGVGAKAVIESGVLDNVEAIFGFHNDPTLPVGTLGSKVGALTAGVDRFIIKVQGEGAHAAKPNEGTDPVVVIAQIVQAFQPIISRNLKPDAHAVVSITQVHSGYTWNVIPEEAELEGTVRTFDKEDRAFIEERIRTILTGIEIANGVKIDLEWIASAPSVINDKKWIEKALAISEKCGYNTKIVKESAIGEDFGYYQEKIPGAFVMIGSGGPYPLHHPKFKIDDEALYPAVYYFTDLISTILAEENK